MKSILLFLIITTSSVTSFSKGVSGYYFIEGTAYSAAETLLANALITVTHNGESTKYITDSKGHFRIKIYWAVPCKSGIPEDQWLSAEEDYNEKTIRISFKCQGARLENKWKIYSGVFENSVQTNVRKVDLHFKR